MHVAVGSTAPIKNVGTRRGRTLLALVVIGLFAALASAPAALAGLSKELAVFSECPLENPEVTVCLHSTTTSGEFKLGLKSVPIVSPVVLQGGLTANSEVLVPAADGNTLSKTPLPVPGGILGVELLGNLTAVTATAELAGPVEVNIQNATKGEGTAVSLPLKAKLDNPLLGNACYIGSNSQPVNPHLTTGTTKPPFFAQPLTGSPGEPSIVAHGKVIEVNNSSLVDNTFAVPGANGCGGFLLELIVDPSVDLIVGVPSPPGVSRAILNGTLAVASPRAVRSQRALPALGRCQKLASLTGGYVDAGCVEENVAHTGRYEWMPGPGPTKSFTAKTGTVKLETPTKKRVTCSASSSNGEYTGAKSANVAVTFTGCVLSTNKEACQSAGSPAGQIKASSLQATLGFITDFTEGPELRVSLGWDLGGATPLLNAECGSAKVPLQVNGSVIGTISAINKMVSAYGLKLTQVGSKQVPESFEEEPKDTLSAAIGGSSEPAGLSAANSVTNPEKLEFKATSEP